ncbi:4-alpha-glucanotransferase DPE2 [Picochlorum sp. SENEW3]|nr:4-alpha-glucanotransferase DPE2 [Picochlorum sp. SENEW3]
MIRVIFSTHYYTRWGERVVITGQGPVLGDYDLELYVVLVSSEPWLMIRMYHVMFACRAKVATCRAVGADGDGSAVHDGGSCCSSSSSSAAMNSKLLWEVTVPFPVDALEEEDEDTYKIVFQFVVVNEHTKEVIKFESNKYTLRLKKDEAVDGSSVYVSSVWVDSSHHANVLKSSAFANVVLQTDHARESDTLLLKKQRGPEKPIHVRDHVLVRFHAMDLELMQGESICITGGTAILGNWQLQQVVWMNQQGSKGCWEQELWIPVSAFPVTYKYAIGRPERDLILEPGESRLIVLPPATDGSVSSIAQYDGFVRRQDRWRGAGVAVPVFSLRTENSIGCGEFTDLVRMGAWCKACGFSLLQLLPVCDTQVRKDWRDSYPYSSLCVFALHPMYLSLADLLAPYVDRNAEVYSALLSDIDSGCAEISSTVSCCGDPDDANGIYVDVDYEETVDFKMKMARMIFEEFGKEDMASDAYMEFASSNSQWLIPYAVFCFLRDMFQTSEHWKWGKFSKPTPEMLDHLASPEQEWHGTIKFYCYLQFKLHTQLLHSSQKLREMGIVLKGDLPIGVDKRSVDTWMHPTLFRMHTSTGAPPDYFDPGGQNWGFPTYNWECMAKDGYAWWRRRLSHMAQYFQAYRIDHILGFFRIWELPANAKSGLLGRFRPSLHYSREDLEIQGLWDIDRLAEPYVTDALLHELLDDPELEEEVKERFFQPSPGNRYRFKEKYASEIFIWSLRSRPGIPDHTAVDTERVRSVLLTLCQNVCLVRDHDNPDHHFFPRFNLTHTTSYDHLEDPHWKHVLKEMHDDSFYGSRSDSMWRHQAYKTLPMMQHATDMLVCGEDLGMIPPCVHPVMEDLGIIGLRIQRMPSQYGAEFGNTGKYGYMTVASPSSHDTTNFRAWFEENAGRRTRYCETILGMHNKTSTTCTPDIVRDVVKQHLFSPSILSIFSIQDIIAMSHVLPQRDPDEETINVPSNPEHYWRYRMHISIQELDQDAELKHTLQNLLSASGRCNSSSSRCASNEDS